MKYDFTTIMNRASQDAIAIDLPLQKQGIFEGLATKDDLDIIPMWVADMNFPVFPGILEAIVRRVSLGHFGYFSTREEYYDAIIAWQSIRNDVRGLAKEHIGYENGVLGGVVSALNVLCSKGDKVLVHSPTYIGFTAVLENNGYEIVHSPLVKDTHGIWRMDYEDMEKKIVDNKIHAVIMCNPHNPCGRAWTKEELAKAYEIFQSNHVFVISDEIWSDIILGTNFHTPSQSVSAYARDNTIALYAPSKTFNLAGLIGSYHIIYNKWLKERIDKESSLSHYNNMNVLSMHALIGAYCREGAQWVDELRQVIDDNVAYACDCIRERLQGVSCMRPEATYMLFIDCSQYCATHGITLDTLLRKGQEAGVIWQDGRPFHGENCIRINLALPTSRVTEAFERLLKYAFADSE